MRSAPAAGSVEIALSRRTHERIGGRRADAEWLAEVWSDPATRVLVLTGGRFPVVEASEGAVVGWRSPEGAPDGLRLLLGERDGVVHVAVVTEDPTTQEAPQEAPQEASQKAPSEAGAEPAGDAVAVEWATLRGVGARLRAEDAGLVVHAVALAEWHRTHRFCPRCGAILEVGAGGHVLECTGCGRDHFPRTDPAVIMLVTDGERALLGRQASWPPGRYSTLAGFVEPGESLEDAVRREVMEEVGVEIGEVSYVGNQPWPFPASLMVGFFAHAETTAIDVDGDEIEDARWFSREEIAALAQEGTVVLPGGFSISRSLVEAWYGDALPGTW
ncbi:MAG: NADH pyrophosphatase, decaps 5'-NAD modified RNA [uncultured Nocardioidaceae bacterium]|uniref:NAD(+) diphosphatase n=1 Tax=uncultured Nocardioidaceae bacterium TaxID=253824 RepID=A0A6J4M776_9ACTN|nr:MAG: NADH pyrophosphatase, decaps 5'-NAD modified RNA [uncultured Nocardioidaceae bacterium]